MKRLLKKYWICVIFYSIILTVVCLGIKFIVDQYIWELELIANGLCC